MATTKPHKGSIKNWTRLSVGDDDYVIVGDFVDHPDFAGKSGHTSLVLKHEGAEIETRNSRYTLVGPDMAEDHHG